MICEDRVSKVRQFVCFDPPSALYKGVYNMNMCILDKQWHRLSMAAALITRLEPAYTQSHVLIKVPYAKSWCHSVKSGVFNTSTNITALSKWPDLLWTMLLATRHVWLQVSHHNILGLWWTPLQNYNSQFKGEICNINIRAARDFTCDSTIR